MTPKERNEIRELAAKKHRGDINAAVCEWLGVAAEYKASGNKVPHGNAGAVFNIKDELEKYEEQDAEESTPAVTSKGDKAD
jgi:hypothetical protein